MPHRLSPPRGTVPCMSRPTTADWSWYESTMVQLRSGGWVSTLPISCPRCGLAWSDEGIQLIRGHVDRGRGCPPDGQVATTSYECAQCGHTSYEQK